ncbi:hypothetical protein GGS23DRAFT_613703 [Durotheca rogersii]|uniref:uncharacterized protein n=1 Tax=Durotheca rogersii TaxID=419775 RepID=UPI00221EEA45|nr:uncharacterized protein GGS23DRAFT_613703 [Durotheca rogersii]KAI5860470.1 hypothetical protein GGS23DRAFT_613703 [Durotheca rogersii]
MANLTQERVQCLYDTFGELDVIDDIIRHRAADVPPAPILGYPRTEDSVDDYERFTGQQLDRLIDGAVKHFIRLGLKPNTGKVAAILAPSNVDFIVTFFALSRLGYTVLCLSLRIPPVAILNLLNQTDCEIIVYGTLPHISANVKVVSGERRVELLQIPRRPDYDNQDAAGEARFVRAFDRAEERGRMALIMHSSGSTGLPKAVALTHTNVLTHAILGAGLDNFAALPLYHMYGVSTTLQAMYRRKTAYLFNTSIPLTAENLVAALTKVGADVVHAVPYALGLLAEQPRGIAYLRCCKIVTSAGARTPDELGDRLVAEGINLGVVFGTTEAGLLGDTMRRVDGDDSWNYIRIYSHIRKYIHMDVVGENQFECVYLKGHPGLSTSNSDDPAPGSWRSKDVFVPHPTIPDVWKYVTRIDDRITLVNGEKVLPLPIEGRVREDSLVREAVVVGVDRPIPGLLLFRAERADHLSDDAFLDAVWPTVEDANSRAEGFSQITRDMICVLSSESEYPRTDKGNIIRNQLYRVFSKEIDELYSKLNGASEGSLRLDLPGLEEVICAAYKTVTGTTLDSVEVDFYSAGIDSLRAIQIRRIFQETLYLNGKQLGTNVVYDYRNAKGLAQYLFSLSQGGDVSQNDSQSLVKQFIDKYSSPGEIVLLTGATGSIGAHILAQMLNSSEYSKVYCLVRGSTPMQRILNSLKQRRLEVSPSGLEKIVAVTADVSKLDFGLGGSFMEQLRAEVRLIVHIAWPVNFNIHLHSFEPQLAGLYNLLNLSVSVQRPEPARLFFCSSISTATNTTGPAIIPDAAIEDFEQTAGTGYAQSKLVGEHMVRNAARRGARSYVLRIGQIVGDTQNGVWNDNEFIPSMIRSALTLKALPVLESPCSWLPVDTLATTVLQLARTLSSAPRPLAIDARDPPIFYNVVNPHVFSWDALLRELRGVAGLEFDAVPVHEWLEALRVSAARGDEEVNPAVRLLGYFEAELSTASDESSSGKVRSDSAREKRGAVFFDTGAARRDSTALRVPPRCVEDGHVKKYVEVWMEKWARPVKT